MIIYIAESIGESIKQDEKLEEIGNCLYSLADEYRRGTHFIIGSRKTLEMIYSQDKILTQDIKMIFRKIYNELTSNYSIMNFCSEYMEVTTEVQFNELRIRNSKKIYLLPVEDIISKRYLNEPYLLSENQDDCKFYERTFYYYVKKQETLENITIFRGEKRGGGGSTVSKEYQQIQNEGNRFCLCILDSDQTYPESYNNGDKVCGNTAKEVIDVDIQSEINTQYYILPVREIENLIPIFYLQESIDVTDQSYEGVKTIKSFNDHDCIEAILYYDFKRGIKGFQIFNCDSSENERPFSTFWQKVIKIIGIDGLCNCKCEQSSYTKSSCKYDILSGVGDRVIDRFMDWLKDENNLMKVIKNDNEYNRVNWHSLSKLIFSWYCGTNEKFTLGQPSNSN